ncbi:hypothetical protein B0T18DRAFT_179428 [Schizothecium vesticola]|uniref:Uncharacterized protein n=1 Tax=Schizothecium vesticola TaxID=314040 RepID=A0AA40K297_9PEZI|nr:hypothetical protein B0T18DRAFT_179428 [Schizothecium vesticola]
MRYQCVQLATNQDYSLTPPTHHANLQSLREVKHSSGYVRVPPKLAHRVSNAKASPPCRPSKIVLEWELLVTRSPHLRRCRVSGCVGVVCSWSFTAPHWPAAPPKKGGPTSRDQEESDEPDESDQNRPNRPHCETQFNCYGILSIFFVGLCPGTVHYLVHVPSQWVSRETKDGMLKAQGLGLVGISGISGVIEQVWHHNSTSESIFVTQHQAIQ